MLTPAISPNQGDPRYGIAVVAACLTLWIAATVPGAIGVSSPSSNALAQQWAGDPTQVSRLTVEYLETSWHATEGTAHTITGPAEIQRAAGDPGIRGRAARAALARMHAAIAQLEERDPAAAARVRDHLEESRLHDLLETPEG